MHESSHLLTINRWSRPATSLPEVRGLVLHWVENPNQSAEDVREYFEMRKFGGLGFGSAHDIIDLDGEVLHVIPYNEMAYHAGSQKYRSEATLLLGDYPNAASIGIELTHPDWTGRPTSATLQAATELFASLCLRFQLDPLSQIVTHSWITGKLTEHGPCHNWFHTHSSELRGFRESVKSHLGGLS